MTRTAVRKESDTWWLCKIPKACVEASAPTHYAQVEGREKFWVALLHLKGFVNGKMLGVGPRKPLARPG